jgi:hypothetical protein
MTLQLGIVQTNANFRHSAFQAHRGESTWQGTPPNRGVTDTDYVRSLKWL